LIRVYEEIQEMAKKAEIVKLLEKEKALSCDEIEIKLGVSKRDCIELIKRLEEKREIIIFGQRIRGNGWEDIIAIATPQGFREGAQKATHIPKSIKWKGWENVIYGLNALSKKVDAITIKQLIEWIGEDPNDPDYQSIAARVIREAGWTPLYDIFDRVVWLSPKLKREIKEYIS
jgi:DNA-binding Lrp family transcriptional regulator